MQLNNRQGVCIHNGRKIVDNIESSGSIITRHNIVANKWSNTVEWCNCEERRMSQHWRLKIVSLLEVEDCLAIGDCLTDCLATGDR